MVDIKHACICSFRNNSLFRVFHSLCNVVKSINKHFPLGQFFVQNAQLINFFLSVKFRDMELVHGFIYEFVVFGQEAIPVNQVTYSQPKSQDL